MISTKREEYTHLSGPELEKYWKHQINKRNPPNETFSFWQIIYLIYAFVWFLMILDLFSGGGTGKDSLGVKNKDNLTSYLGVKIDISKVTDRKELFQFFQKHDINGSKSLDSKELLFVMLHLYQDTLKNLNESDKFFPDSELSWMVDFIMNSDVRNGNNSISYSELLLKQRENSSVKFSFPKNNTVG